MTTAVRILIIAVSIILIYFGVTGLQTGVVRGKYGTVIHKEESPISYWLGVGAFMIAGAGGILLAVLSGMAW